MFAGANGRAGARRVFVAVAAGTAIEWYDFFIYGLAAGLVFGPLFFPTFDPLVGKLAAFSTFAVGFAARPVAALVFGHFGDKIGRKRLLIVTMLLMGLSTAAIGLLPPYHTLGAAAPILLVTLRLLQGFGVGGETGGACVTAVEHATRGRLGICGSSSQVGIPAGLLLGNIAFLASVGLSHEQFLAWGWRIPFLLSSVLVLVALYIRLQISETPTFRSLEKARATVAVPIFTLLRTQPRKLVLATFSIVGTSAYFYVLLTFLPGYITASGLSKASVLTGQLIGAAVEIGAILYFAGLSDRIGRRNLVLAGIIAAGVWTPVMFWFAGLGSTILIVAGYVVAMVVHAISTAVHTTFVAELFPAPVRYSGMGFTFQLGIMIGGAAAPVVASALLVATHQTVLIAVFVAALCALSLAATVLIRPKDIVQDPAPAAEGQVAIEPGVA
ncbi:MHS family MFS transporter [Amycolatopsis sp. K13G38]|uniref:MHS family MFS transporter n=1 Tax=Amycolatopsis acididurans TaxID=2724524 RepID=A0ABX1JB71_9PSEU|nr:MFS transporter [Amycolatopsis acididurans]NKQ56139.1 MHS family MFS transporter [Amycolatopsis acididurans]